MSDQRLERTEIYVAAGIVALLFLLGAVVAYRLAPDESGSIVTALVVSVTAVAIVAVAATLEDTMPEAVAPGRVGDARPDVAVITPLDRWMQRVDLAGEDDDAHLLALLRNPLERVAVRLGAEGLPQEAAAGSPTPEALLEALERL